MNGELMDLPRRALNENERENARAAGARYRQLHREEVRARKALDYQTHRAERDANHIAWRKKNPERHREKARERDARYRGTHRPESLAKQTAYREQHREELNAKQRARYAAQLEVGRAKQLAWARAHPEERRATYLAWRAKHPEYLKTRRGHERRRLYGLGPAAFDALLTSQAHACAICAVSFTKTPHVDHDHQTGAVRGLLCNSCNQGLGRFRDDPVLMQRAIRYLEHHAAAEPIQKAQMP